MIENHTDPYGDTLDVQLGTIHGESFNVTLRSTGPTRGEKDLAFATHKIGQLVLFLDLFLQAHGLIAAKFDHYRRYPKDFAPKKRPMHAPRPSLQA